MPSDFSFRSLFLTGGTVPVQTGCENPLMEFWLDESGSSTVEMVVMMGATVGIGIATMDVVSNGVENLSNDISTFLSNIEISTSFDDDQEDEPG